MVLCSPSLGMRLCTEGRLSAECGRAGFWRLKWILQNNVKHICRPFIFQPDIDLKNIKSQTEVAHHSILWSDRFKETLWTEKGLCESLDIWSWGAEFTSLSSESKKGLSSKCSRPTGEISVSAGCYRGFHIIAGLNLITLILINRGWRTQCGMDVTWLWNRWKDSSSWTSACSWMLY